MSERRPGEVGSLPEPLTASYAAGDLCLFVGAGVSRSCGLPDWRELSRAVVNRIPKQDGPGLGAVSAARRQGRPIPADPNALLAEKKAVLQDEEPLLAMRYMRLEVGAGLGLLVSDVLYSRHIEVSAGLRELVRLDNVRRVCCYNYDDLLARAYDEEGTDHLALLPGCRIPLESPRRLVFYPHGYLPEPGRGSVDATDAIVLSEDDYFELYRQPYGWANLVQLTLLLNYTALFVGCSLLDPNVRRLLDIVVASRPDHRHYAIFREEKDRPAAQWLQAREGIATRSVQRRLLGGLGIEPIWVDSFDEIADVLRALRASSVA